MQGLTTYWKIPLSSYPQNTFIGGVGTTINTPALLAVKLNLGDISRVKSFEVVGNNIRCHISGNYVMPQFTWRDNPQGITYYIDKSGLCTDLNSQCFGGSFFFESYPLEKIHFPNAVSANGTFSYNLKLKVISLPKCVTILNSFLSFAKNVSIIHIPKCTVLGDNSLNNNCFVNMTGAPKIYVNQFLMTNNLGGMDGDLIYAQSIGCTIIPVLNTTPPLKTTTLSLGTATAATLQLNFTPPTSINIIEKYEVFIDEIPYQIISGSGQVITNLAPNTSYSKIEVRAIDQYYNRADQMDLANMITASTL